MNLNKLLTKIGLRQAEIDVFTACSEGFPRVSNIAESVKLNRTNVYAVLESLIEKGLVVELNSGKVKQFRAVSISRLYDFVEQEKLKLKKDAHKLDTVLESLDEKFAVKRHANVEFFNGIDEVSRYYMDLVKRSDSVETKKITKFMRYAMVGDLIDIINDESEQAYKEFKSSFIPLKMIVPDNEKSLDIINYQLSKHPNYFKYNDIKLVDFDDLSLGSEVVISPDDVSIFSLTKEETWAVKFSDKTMVSTFQAMFGALWSQGKKLPKGK
ncbi:MAG: hypothetical protein HN846_01735 [Candidatus Pacebacteria bacterium]|nr:hypothetical protein [Candidatus Paceibacterota bacterium]MBT3511595.1 hypothetical protein [Candidatus Paceibacterota bacterium]MBT4004935.1 hypothetical protein [Candidatus Paceibacterota bacterium]MBT4358711.1 hypothetical protein [Candidatus Paceibacterota bacterium]MBT4680678.1 hypothetical protein [Candidatus Paceibacterota bacterium]